MKLNAVLALGPGALLAMWSLVLASTLTVGWAWNPADGHRPALLSRPRTTASERDNAQRTRSRD
jgi:hypothetical protein